MIKINPISIKYFRSLKQYAAVAKNNDNHYAFKIHLDGSLVDNSVHNYQNGQWINQQISEKLEKELVNTLFNFACKFSHLFVKKDKQNDDVLRMWNDSVVSLSAECYSFFDEMNGFVIKIDDKLYFSHDKDSLFDFGSSTIQFCMMNDEFESGSIDLGNKDNNELKSRIERQFNQAKKMNERNYVGKPCGADSWEQVSFERKQLIHKWRNFN